MSGALGKLPQAVHSNKGTNLVPESPDESTPPPWSDEGPPACKIRMTVTSGFYVRSFCHDLGTKLDSAAVMAELCRSRQSDFTVGGTNCLEYEDLAKGEEVWGPKVADIIAKWNGEPVGKWPGDDVPSTSPVTPSDQPNNQRPNSKVNHNQNRKHSEQQNGSQFRKPEKRRRSNSSSEAGSPPPRKVPAGSPKNGSRGNSPKRFKSEDEKSWNGIDD